MSYLVYVVTYSCNLNCSYCPVPQSPLTLTKSVIDASQDLLHQYDFEKIKLFGGEPFAQFEIVAYLVDMIRNHDSDIPIHLVTNGVLLDKAKINWVKKHEIHLTVSLDGNEFTQSKNRKGVNSYKNIIEHLHILPKDSVFNVVVAPNTAKFFLYNFTYLLDLGITNINILPAYYNTWTDAELSQFKSEMSKVLTYIKNKNIAKDIFIKNIDNYSNLTFFNQAMVVDTDGGIYNNNSILSTHFIDQKPKFKIGDVFAGIEKNTPDFDPHILIQHADPQLVETNSKLDHILNSFVYKYKTLL